MLTSFRFIFFLFIFLRLADVSSAQDKIIFMNGKVEKGRITDTTQNHITYIDSSAKEVKPVEIEKYRVFSIVYEHGKEVIYYEPDTANDEEFSIIDMKYFIYGEQDALKSYKAPWSTVGGVVFGLGGGLLGHFVFSPLVPGVYSVLSGAKWIKIKRQTVSNEEFLQERTYVMGYERVARNKRVQNALKGSGIGLAAGLTIFAIFLSAER